MDRLKGARTTHHLRSPRRVAPHLLTRRNGPPRQQAAKAKESLLKAKSLEASKLQERVELARQSNRLMKDLLQALQKLDEAKKKLDAATEKTKIFESKTQDLHDQADNFESKYQESKKKYNQLILELDNLSIN